MTDWMGQLWTEYDLDGLEREIETLFPEFSFDFGSLFSRILQGDVVGALRDGLGSVVSGLGSQLGGIKETLIWILILGVGAALLTHFVEMFDSHQVADIAFYFVYLLLTTILLRCFQECASVTVQTVKNLVSFIQTFVPAYILSMGVATGTTTAAAYYSLLLMLIYFVQNVLLIIVIPCIYSYVFLSIVNGIWIEEKLAMVTELMGKGIRLMLKLSLGAITGISLIQSMITPVIDSAKSVALQKTVSAIPGIGDVADGVVEVVMGSAVVIKNSIGVVMVILLLVICAVPLIKIFVIAVLLKLSAALLGIISDKRITACTVKVGEGSELLLRTAGTALILFLLTISVAAFTTNRGF